MHQSIVTTAPLVRGIVKSSSCGDKQLVNSPLNAHAPQYTPISPLFLARKQNCGAIGKVKTRYISPAIIGTTPDQGGGGSYFNCLVHYVTHVPTTVSALGLNPTKPATLQFHFWVLCFQSIIVCWPVAYIGKHSE